MHTWTLTTDSGSTEGTAPTVPAAWSAAFDAAETAIVCGVRGGMTLTAGPAPAAHLSTGTDADTAEALAVLAQTRDAVAAGYGADR